MPKPVIAVDIDEVLSPYVSGLIAWHNLQYGTNYTWQDFNTYEFNKVWGGDRELAIIKSTQHFDMRGPVSPLADSVRVLTRLKQDYTLIVVTSRMLLQKPQTEAWIHQHFPEIFQEILLCNHWSLNNNGPVMKKSAACLLHDARYLIDDLPHYVEEVAGTGMTGLLFGDYPWESTSAASPANSTRFALAGR